MVLFSWVIEKMRGIPALLLNQRKAVSTYKFLA